MLHASAYVCNIENVLGLGLTMYMYLYSIASSQGRLRCLIISVQRQKLERRCWDEELQRQHNSRNYMCVYYIHMHTYLDVPCDVMLSYEPSVEGLIPCLVGGEVEAGLVLDCLGVVVDKELGGEVVSVGTLGLEQRQIVGTCRMGM